jgi:hypothetical protein
MGTWHRHLLRSWLVGAAIVVALPWDVAAQNASPTFAKDIAPIFQAKCQGCHRPGETAPMPLRTYQEVRPWARSIKNKVSRREMPPWFIDRTTGIQRFKNDASLSDAQIETIVRWVDGGAREGDAADMPLARAFPESQGWNIGQPDLVVTQEEPFKMYANGSDWWSTFTVDSHLTEDRWIKAAQLKPGNTKIVHHFCAGVVPPGGREGLPGGAVAPADRYAEELLRAAENERQLAGEMSATARLRSGAICRVAPEWLSRTTPAS